MQHILFGQVHIDALNDMSHYYHSCAMAMQSFIKSNQTIVMTLQKSSNPTNDKLNMIYARNVDAVLLFKQSVFI